ncbi:MAG: DNA-binding protein WhiA [Firmicutes bacterium]|nr:DNA-binding protein WhiA [Bacillota bacterium]
MSFTTDIKKELTGLETGRKCCQLAQLTGFTRFAGSIVIIGGKPGLKVTTDNAAVARLFITLVKEYFGAKTALQIESGQLMSKGRSYSLIVTPEMNAEAILRELGILGVLEGSNYIKDGLESTNYKKRCCKKAALRGIFLAAGSMSDPAKAYHLEISCANSVIASDVKKLLGSFGLKGKVVSRRNKEIVYLKDGEQISEFLAVLGCNKQLFRFEDIRIAKEIKNKANRINNCEGANLDKTVNAAQKVISDINYIEKTVGLDYLPGKLRETAVLRRDNPELALSELAQLFEPPLGKSGLYHRLEKISEAASELKGN